MEKIKDLESKHSHIEIIQFEWLGTVRIASQKHKRTILIEDSRVYFYNEGSFIKWQDADEREALQLTKNYLLARESGGIYSPCP